MEKYIVIIALGIVLIVLGIVNYKGNISSIHWYNRRKVSDADIPKYGKCVGIGTIICGISLLVTAILEIVLQNPIVEVVIPVGLVIGLVFIFYGQFKYNKGLF